MNTRSTLASSICSLISDIGVIQSGGNVQTWEDQSGCGNNAIAAPPAPGAGIVANGLNGKQVLAFGGPLTLQFPLTSSPEYSFFFVAKTGTVKGELSSIIGSNNIPGFNWAFGIGSHPTQGLGWAGNGNTLLGNSDFIPANTYKLLSIIKSASKWDIYCNGEYIRSVSDSSVADYMGDKFWAMGRSVVGSMVQEFAGMIAEVLVCEDALNNGQRKKVEKEIMTYWAL